MAHMAKLGYLSGVTDSLNNFNYTALELMYRMTVLRKVEMYLLSAGMQMSPLRPLRPGKPSRPSGPGEPGSPGDPNRPLGPLGPMMATP